MRRLGAAVACIAVAVTGVAATTSATASPGRQRTLASGHRVKRSYTPPPLTWSRCTSATLKDAGAQCATLTVPLDYRRPHGPTISLAVSRVKHTSSHYQGAMLTNPGGPGGSGLGLATLGRYVPGKVALDYDWIGFDPRGVGSSRPALTCDPGFYGYNRPNYTPYNRRLANLWLRRSANYAAACSRSGAARAGLLAHLKTVDNVRDMESLRKALGQRRINYYGFSYGTDLGQVYATLHPNRVRRFVFDGVVDPRRSWYYANLDQDRAFQKTINVYFGWLAKHHAVYHLGTTRAQVARGFYVERRKLDRHAAGGIIGSDELTDVILSAGYYVYGWVDIAKAYTALVKHGDWAAVKEMYDESNPQTPGSDNGNAIYLATSCSDGPWPRSIAKIFRDNRRLNATAPFLTWDNAWFNGPCSYWPSKPGRPVHVDGHRVTSNILLISETLDPATPYPGALEVRRRFPHSSLIEGVGGTTHAGSLSGVACTDDTIATYLADGTVPARKPGNRSDLRCPPVPRPDPTSTAADGKHRGVGPGRDRLRDLLAAAQVR